MNKLDEVQLSSLSSSGSSSPQYSGPTNDTKNPEAMNSSLLMDVSNSGSVPYDLTTLIDIDMSSYSPKVPSANEPGNSWQWRNPSLKNPCYAGIGFNFKFNLWVIIDEALCYHLSLENAGIRLCTFRKICITPLIDFVITAVCPSVARLLSHFDCRYKIAQLWWIFILNLRPWYFPRNRVWLQFSLTFWLDIECLI